MTENINDGLLSFGKILARLLQGISAVAGGIVLLLIPAMLLVSEGMMPGFGGASRSQTIAASPVTVVAILVLMALILAALFTFFGKLRAIIVSAGEGDPFTPANADRLTAMAWLFLGVKIMVLVIGGLRVHLANLIDKDAYGDASIGLSVYDLDAVVIVVVLLILARIFRHGAAMREDLKGTV